MTTPDDKTTTPATPEATADGKAPPVADAEKAGHGGRAILAVLVLVVILGLAGYASLPFWRGSIPEPYRGYLPDLPPSETRARLDDLEARTKRAEDALAKARADLAALQGRTESAAAAAPKSENAAGLDELRDRMAALELRLRTPTASAVAAAPASAADAGLAHRVDLLAGLMDRRLAEDQARNATLEKSVAEAIRRVESVEASRADAASVLRLSDRITDVENLARNVAARKDASLANLLAVVQLRAKAADGLPFDAELRTARALAADKDTFDADTARFAKQAQSGVSTPAALKREFDAVAAAAVRAAASPAGDRLVDKMAARVVSLVTVRRIDGQGDGNPTDARLARAGRLLDSGDLVSAVAELKAVDQPAAARVLAPWIARAEARVTLDSTLSALTAEALSRVAAEAMQAPAAKPVPAPAKKEG